MTKPNDAVSSSLLASVDIAYLDTRNLGADFDVLLLLGFRFVPSCFGKGTGVGGIEIPKGEGGVGWGWGAA